MTKDWTYLHICPLDIYIQLKIKILNRNNSEFFLCHSLFVFNNNNIRTSSKYCSSS